MTGKEEQEITQEELFKLLMSPAYSGAPFIAMDPNYLKESRKELSNDVYPPAEKDQFLDDLL